MFLNRHLPLAVLIVLLPFSRGAAQSLYSFGNPTAAEQEYLEWINRARANPTAEGIRLANSTHPDVLFAINFFSVDLGMLQSEMAAITALPPLAPHAALTSAARGHAQWMLDNALQAHDQPGGLTFEQRLAAAGYTGYSSAGENIYAYSEDPEYGHAGFVIDWGDPAYGPVTGGMQNPRGHRDNILSTSFREIGIGVVHGSNPPVGPELVAQAFGNRFAAPYYGTGVAYYDLDGDNFYDAGEGIEGLTVNVSGATQACLTATGGGWVVPIPSTAASRTITFSGLNLSEAVQLTVAANSNAKADLKLTYVPPVFTRVGSVFPGTPHQLAVNPVGGATGYQWTSWEVNPTAAENCDSLARVTATTGPGYSVVNPNVTYEGSASWRLQIGFPNPDQILLFDEIMIGSPASSLTFRSRFRRSVPSESAKVQVSELGSDTWLDVYSQAGTGVTGESTFSLRSANLSAMNGKRFRLRFVLDYNGGGAYLPDGDNVGWFIDDIQFTQVSSLGNETSATSASPSIALTPAASSGLMVEVAPVISGVAFPASHQLLSAAIATFANWAAYHESVLGLPAGTLAAAPLADPDGDGRPTLMEYAFDSAPAVADPSPATAPQVALEAGHIILRYQKNTSRGDLTLTAQASPDCSPGSWKSPGQPGAPAGFTDTLVSTVGTLQSREARIPVASAGTRQFLRLAMAKP